MINSKAEHRCQIGTFNCDRRCADDGRSDRCPADSLRQINRRDLADGNRRECEGVGIAVVAASYAINLVSNDGCRFAKAGGCAQIDARARNSGARNNQRQSAVGDGLECGK